MSATDETPMEGIPGHPPTAEAPHRARIEAVSVPDDAVAVEQAFNVDAAGEGQSPVLHACAREVGSPQGRVVNSCGTDGGERPGSTSPCAPDAKDPAHGYHTIDPLQESAGAVLKLAFRNGSTIAVTPPNGDLRGAEPTALASTAQPAAAGWTERHGHHES